MQFHIFPRSCSPCTHRTTYISMTIMFWHTVLLQIKFNSLSILCRRLDGIHNNCQNLSATAISSIKWKTRLPVHLFFFCLDSIQHWHLRLELFSHILSHPWKHALFMFASFHPLLLHCAGNFAKHRSILWKLHLMSHLPPLTGLYSTLNGIKYFIITSPVIDTELWLCLDKNFVLHT